MLFPIGRPEHGDQQGNTRAGKETSPGDFIREVGFEADAVYWNVSEAFADYISAVSFQPDKIAEDFHVFKSVKHADSSPLEQLRHYMTMTEEEFRDCVDKLRRQLLLGGLEYLQDIWDAYRILDHLSQQRLIVEDPGHWKDSFVQLAKYFDTTKDTPASLNVWQEKLDDNQTAVLKALKDLEQRILAEKAKAENVTAQRILIEGEVGTMIEPYRSPFVDADPEGVYSRLRLVGRPGILRLRNLYFQRLGIQNIGTYTMNEVPFATALANLIDAKTPSVAPVTLDDAAWLNLRDALRCFIAKVTS